MYLKHITLKTITYRLNFIKQTFKKCTQNFLGRLFYNILLVCVRGKTEICHSRKKYCKIISVDMLCVLYYNFLFLSFKIKIEITFSKLKLKEIHEGNVNCYFYNWAINHKFLSGLKKYNTQCMLFLSLNFNYFFFKVICMQN